MTGKTINFTKETKMDLETTADFLKESMFLHETFIPK